MNTTGKFDDILKMYNLLSNQSINKDDFILIIPKIELITKDISLDNVEMIQLIDVLLEFKNLNQLNQINKESITLVTRLINNSEVDLEGTIYLSLLLKHLLLPHQLNKCDNENNILLFLSEFETIIELIIHIYNKKDLELLFKYNQDLVKLIIEYIRALQLYKSKMNKEIILSTIISHLTALLYFNLDKYDSNYHLISFITNNIMEEYQKFINYCYNEGIYDNFSKIVLEWGKLKQEYFVSQNILDYAFEINKKEKRKC